jgi:hypothetical protein
MPRFVPVGKGTGQAQKYKKQMICKTKYKNYESAHKLGQLGKLATLPERSLSSSSQ